MASPVTVYVSRLRGPGGDVVDIQRERET